MAQYGAWAAGQVHVDQVVIAGQLPRHSGAAVTLTPPLGERDPRFPLRGREVLVASLADLCRNGGQGRLRVVHGLGGCGKTAVVLEAVHRFLEHRTDPPARVWWVDARDGAAVETGLRVVARQAGLRARDIRGEDVADALWRQLARLAPGWVLVLDNVDDPSVLDGPGRLAAGTGWLRPHTTAGGLVVVTSRQGTADAWGARAVLHAVKQLGAADAAQVLLDRAGTRAGDAVQARALAVRLGGLPLALHLCGSYLAEATAMPAAFRDPDTPVDFAAWQRALEGGSSPLDAAGVMARIRQLAIELLRRRGFPLAERLLEVLASFADAPLPHTLLLRADVLSHGVADLGTVDGRSVWRTLTGLAGLGLLELEQSPPAEQQLPVVRLHPLIRDASRQRPDPATALSLLHHAVTVAGMQPPEEPDVWPAWQLLVPHALELARHAATGALTDPVRLAGMEIAELGARYLQSQGMFEQACQQLQHVLAVRRRLLGEEHPDTLSTRHNLAGVLHDQGHLVPARAEYEQVWAARRRLQGGQEADTLTAQHELARVLHDQGHLAGARALFEQVLDARRQLQGDYHTHTLAARHELARVLHHQGDLARARQEYESILDLRQRTLGLLHPRTLTARHNLACLLYDVGDWAAAHEELRATFTARTTMLGATHPQTLSTQDKLARLLHDAGQQNTARELLQTALNTARQTLGEMHPDTRRMARTLNAWTSGEAV